MSPARLLLAALAPGLGRLPVLLPAQQVNQLSYQVPAGWVQAVDPASNLVTLMPRTLPFGRLNAITVLRPEVFAGPAEAFHAQVVMRGGNAGRPLEPPRERTLGRFLVTTVHQVMANGMQLWSTIYTARWGNLGQTFVYARNTPDMSQKYLPVVDSMISHIEVPEAVAAAPAEGAGSPGPAAPAGCFRPNGIEFCPRPVIPESRAVPITGAYLATAAGTSFSVGRGVQSRVETTLLVLYANGVAVRSELQKSGAIDANYEAEGFATVDPRDTAEIGARAAGRWTESGGRLTIAWRIGPPTTLVRDGKDLKDDYVRWMPYPTVDGLRLEGRYLRVVEFGSPWEVTLHRNGTFSSNGLNNTMGGETINPGFPVRGQGTYEITRWSLVLHFSTGFVQSINLMTGRGDSGDPGDIVLNGYDFVKD